MPVEFFESCLNELETIVEELEAGDLSLEVFRRGMTLSLFATGGKRGPVLQ